MSLQAKKITRIASDCPLCSKPLVRKTRKKDGEQFMSCSGYPTCNFAEPLNPHIDRLSRELEDVTRDRDELLHIIREGRPVE